MGVDPGLPGYAGRSPICSGGHAGSFLVADATTHARLRSLVARAFAPAPLERMRAVAQRIAEETLDGLGKGTDEFDLFDDFAARVPLRVMCTLLGIPESYAEELRTFLPGAV